MEIIKKLIWCSLRVVPNYTITSDCDSLIKRCIFLVKNCPDVKITIDYYYIDIKTKTTKIQLWNANKWHAWLSQGSVNGRKYNSKMPKRGTAYEFKKLLESKGYDLHPPKHDGIKIDDINC